MAADLDLTECMLFFWYYRWLGFHLSLRSGHPCLNILWNWWTLNARWKVLLSIILVFGLAVAVEGLAKFRYVTVAQWKLQQRVNSSSGTTTTTTAAATLRRYSIPVLHGLQAGAGYLLMLIAMTFSLELLCSVVMGLATGYGIFFKLSPADNYPASRSSAAADGDDPYQLRQHVTTNPCCEFMQEESKETSSVAASAGMRRPIATAAGFQSNARSQVGDDNLCLILEGEEDPAPSVRDSTRNSA